MASYGTPNYSEIGGQATLPRADTAMSNPGAPQEEDLKFSDRLAVERTILAADRSLLAWLRTSLSLVGFGFTIYKVLQYLLQRGPETVLRPQTPRNVGLFLILTGTIPLLMATIQYRRTLRRLYARIDSTVPPAVLDPSFVAACVIILLGFTLVAVIVFGVRLL